MDNEDLYQETEKKPEEYPETVEYGKDGKLSDGEKQAKNGIKLLLVPPIICSIIFLILHWIQASGVPTDDSNALGWVVGFFVLIPGVSIIMGTYLAGLSEIISSESMYKKFLIAYPNKTISEKRKKLHSICSVVKIIAILLPILAIVGFVIYYRLGLYYYRLGLY